MAGGFVDLVVPDRHSRRLMLAGLQRMSLLALLLLVAQYALGIVLNLYVAVPAADAHAGITQVIANGPLALTLHVLLGLGLVGTAIVLLVRAVVVGDRRFAVLAAGGLTAIGGAFAAGEIFVRNGQQFASAAMAILTAVALLCYIGTLTLAGAAYRQVAHHRRRAMDSGEPDADDIDTWPPDYETDDTGQAPAWPPDYDDDSGMPWRQSRDDRSGMPWRQGRDDRSGMPWRQSRDDRSGMPWRQSHDDPGLTWLPDSDGSGPNGRPSHDLDDADLGLIWTPDADIPAPRPSWPDSGRSWSAPPGAR
jgi:hypothetical protein